MAGHKKTACTTQAAIFFHIPSLSVRFRPFPPLVFPSGIFYPFQRFAPYSGKYALIKALVFFSIVHAPSEPLPECKLHIISDVRFSKVILGFIRWKPSSEPFGTLTFINLPNRPIKPTLYADTLQHSSTPLPDRDRPRPFPLLLPLLNIIYNL